jgi:hypothetical protein
LGGVAARRAREAAVNRASKEAPVRHLDTRVESPQNSRCGLALQANYAQEGCTVKNVKVILRTAVKSDAVPSAQLF